MNGFVALHRDNPRLHRVLSSEVPVSRSIRRRTAALTGAIVHLAAAGLVGRVTNRELSARLLVDTAEALRDRWIVEPGGKPISAELMSDELINMLRASLSTAIPNDWAAKCR